LVNLSIATSARANYKFSHWSGDLSGSFDTNSISVGHTQKSITANFVAVSTSDGDTYTYLPIVLR
jgi:hypothetical protein